jgi:hypothetical protein
MSAISATVVYLVHKPERERGDERTKKEGGRREEKPTTEGGR